MKMQKTGALFIVVLGFFSGCAPCHAPQEPRAMMKAPAQAAEPLRNVYFAVNSDELSQTGEQTLRRNARWLRANPDSDVKIEGFADERGSTQHNKELGMRRALTAASYLESLGIEAKRIKAVSYGEERPLDPAHNEEAWSKNRRVEFVAGGERSRL
jgi:peptidoglycan-associated lipoprotein